MKQLKQFILEKFKISSNNIKKPKYNYYPKDQDELKELVKKLIKERGNDADLNDIDVSKVKDMSFMFYDSEFNGDISSWDVSKVKYMNYMFTISKFNGDISKWDVSNVENMEDMFSNSEFNQDISEWDVRKVKDMKYIFEFCPLEKNSPKWYKEEKIQI